MRRFFLLFFIVIPLVEIWILVSGGRAIGAGSVILTLLASAFFGIFMVRHEGMRTLTTIQERVSRGEMPGETLLDGVLLLVAGLLMIVPGYLSDFFGLILIFPWTRTLVRRWFLAHLEGKIKAAAFHGDPAGAVIEGELLPPYKDDF